MTAASLCGAETPNFKRCSNMFPDRVYIQRQHGSHICLKLNTKTKLQGPFFLYLPVYASAAKHLWKNYLNICKKEEKQQMMSHSSVRKRCCLSNKYRLWKYPLPSVLIEFSSSYLPASSLSKYLAASLAPYTSACRTAMCLRRASFSFLKSRTSASSLASVNFSFLLASSSCS